MIMLLGLKLDIINDSGKVLRTECWTGVGRCSAIKCTVSCLASVHKMSREMPRVCTVTAYKCLRCKFDKDVLSR